MTTAVAAVLNAKPGVNASVPGLLSSHQNYNMNSVHIDTVAINVFA